MKINGPLTIDSFLKAFKEFLARERETWAYLDELERAKPWIPREGYQEYRAELRQMLDKASQLLDERQVFEALADALMDHPYESRQLFEQEARDIIAREEAAAACTQIPGVEG